MEGRKHDNSKYCLICHIRY